MSRTSNSRSRFALASVVVIGLLVLSTGSAAAATGPGTDASFSQSGTSADASAGGCASNGDGTSTCSDVSISIFVGVTKDDVSGTVHARNLCVNVYSYSVDDATGDVAAEPVSESGCRGLSVNALRLGNKLSSVTLASTTVPIAETVCDKSADPIICETGPSHDVRVAGTWTGAGPIFSVNTHSTFDDGACRVTQAEKSQSRGATFAGLFDGHALTADAAQIVDGKTSFTSRCVKP